MKTNKDYTVKFMDYGEITVPEGTELTHKTASGIDESYHFVNEYGWIYKNYPKIANILQDDVSNYGINVPKEYVNYEDGGLHKKALEYLKQGKSEIITESLMWGGINSVTSVIAIKLAVKRAKLWIVKTE